MVSAKKGTAKKGSVKDVEILEKPTREKTGTGVFHFTDNYSVFDYGRMPDKLPGKGESLCRMASFNFQKLDDLGIKSHFRNFSPPNKMEVDLVRILYPGKDKITTETRSYLVPLEIIFRNSLPAGSSVFKRLDSGELKPKHLGLKERPEPGQPLPQPILDFWTKLEPLDRLLTEEEARELAGLTPEEMEKAKEIALKVNEFITNQAEEVGLEHADGKVELAMDGDRNLILADVCGTLDENRFLYNGFQVSKQAIRNFYKKTDWYETFRRIKKDQPKKHWPEPPKLPPDLVQASADMYKAACELWTGEKIWGLSLEETIEKLKKF